MSSLYGRDSGGYRSSAKRPVCVVIGVVLSIFIVLASCPPKAASAQTPEREQYPHSEKGITFRIIPSVNHTFGYDILVEGKPKIHQPNIPGLPGNEGFSTREKAQRTAEFVVTKMRRNEMPPTVTLEDLRNMGALK